MLNIHRRMMMAQCITYKGIPLMITNVGDEPTTLVIEHIIEHELYYKESAKSFYKPFPDNMLTIPSGETIHIFGYFIDVNQSNYAHFTFAGGQIHLEGSIRAIKAKASSEDSYPKAFYYSLFSKNLNIISASRDLFKEFDSMPLEESMFAFIFDGCTNLETAPDLYGSNNRSYTFEGSFRNCQNLKKLPVIYCKSVQGGTFRYTFLGCSSMDIVDEVTVPSAGGTAHTYTSMFDGCKSLTKLPNFTDNGASYCNLMFNHCTNITDASNITLGVVGKAPALVAYANMFAGCTNLVHTPKILITTLGDERPNYWGAFNGCFNGCIKLDKLEVNFKDFTPSNFNYWMRGVSPTGTFICPKELGQALEGYYQSDGTWVEPTVSRGESAVPAGWYIDYPIIDARDGDANAMALMAVISQQAHADGTPWVKDSSVMMRSEAEKVESISSVFNQIKQNYSFEAFQYFTLIKSIDNSCFGGSNSSYLTKLALPYSVVSINKSAFAGCTRLNLVIPENSLLETIGDSAFQTASSSLLYIPKLVTSISDRAFINAAIRSFKVSDENTIYRSENHCIIKDNVIVVGGSYFDDTQSMSDTIDTIGVNAFMGRKLSKIIITKGITTLQNSCYYNNTNAKSLYIPDTVISIAHDSFNLCSKLESIEVEAANQKYEVINNTLIEKDSRVLIIGCKNSTIPSDVVTLSDYCFYDCEGLETIDIPDSVTTIGVQAFDNIASLKKVTIGSGVSYIKSLAFFRTNNLGKIKINATAPPTITTNSFTTNVIIYVPDDSFDTYKSADVWSTIASRIKPISELPQE